MTIYRIHPDRMHYRLMTISSKEVVKKLGEEYPFHIDPTPRAYNDVWHSLEIDFYDSANKKKTAELPDMTVDGGKLFVNSKAFELLQSEIGNQIECLPVTYNGNNGHILNILALAENSAALDEKLSLKNEWGDLSALSFIEEKLGNTPLFRSEFEGYMGVFCNDTFKNSVENHSLKGIIFSTDLGNIFPPDPSAQAPLKN